MSIKLRLTAWYSGIVAVMLLIFSTGIYGFVYLNTYGDLKDRLLRQAEQLNFTGRNGYDGSLSSVDIDFLQQFRLEEANVVVQTYIYGSNVYQQTDNLKRLGIRFPVPVQEHSEKDQGFKQANLGGYHFMIYQKPIYAASNQAGVSVVGTMQVAAPTLSEDRLMDRLQTILLLGSTATLLAAFTIGLFLSRKAMHPIGNVIRAANGIQTGNDLSVRIEHEGPPDEIGGLIDTVNGMIGRMEGIYKELEESYAAQRRFVSDASHELRTPLTTIRGNIELLQKVWDEETAQQSGMSDKEIRELSTEAVRDIADEAQRMSRLVGDMLSLARSDTGRTFPKEPVPLEPMLGEVARRAALLPREAEWVPGDMSKLNGKYVVGNKDYLQQMLFIFIDNAFKYTPSGEVRLDTVFYEDQVGIRIADTGIGMDKDEVPYIFDRFYRADKSRGMTEGIGLGLSIAKWIIEEHNGSVEVVTRQGEGTMFIVWLPSLFAPPLE